MSAASKAPSHREQVTIFFSDIVGFTQIAQQLAPIKVSEMLDRLYTEFDRLSREHNVFKVDVCWRMLAYANVLLAADILY
jgi:class 3 adenylate cyclase